MIMKTPKFFNSKIGIGIFVLPVAFLFMLVACVKRYFARPYKSQAKVICVGNITLGGVGKTPLVAKLIEHFLDMGIKVGVVSRGYGGRLSSGKPVVINAKKHTASDVGDEPFMLALKFPTVPVVICANRMRSAKCLEKKVDVIIMDDGLQNYTLAKDKVILVFDGKNPMGNGMIFPSGPLRETLSSGLNKSDVAVVMREKNSQLEEKISKKGKPVFNAKVVPLSFNKFKGAEVVAFAGIGNPMKFYDTLRSGGLKIVRTFDFPDHYSYTAQDMEMIICKAGEKKIFTTMKDYVKIPDVYKKRINVVDIDLNIENESQFFDIIDK